MVAEQWEPEERFEQRRPRGTPANLLPGGLTTQERAALEERKAQEQEAQEQVAVTAVLDALAGILEGSGTLLRAERQQEPPPPQPGNPAPHVVFERPPGAKPLKKKGSRRKKTQPPAPGTP